MLVKPVEDGRSQVPVAASSLLGAKRKKMGCEADMFLQSRRSRDQVIANVIEQGPDQTTHTTVSSPTPRSTARASFGAETMRLRNL